MNTKLHKLAISAFLLLGLAFSSTACSVKGSIGEEPWQSDLSAHYTQQTGIAAGSTQNEVVNGYRVSATLGDNMSGIQETVNGYKVFQSIQGNVNSATFEPTSQ